MQAEKIVTIIPPDPSLLREQKRRAKKLRVAAYCRVSTDQEEQQSSYEAQIAYYTETIENNSDWVMAGIFADEGISGTSAKKRPEFLKLMELCKRGKVDMILVKISVGRDMAEQMAEFKALSDEIRGLQAKLDAQDMNHAGKQNCNSRINDMIEVLQQCNLRLAEYDDRLVRLMVERVKVVEDDKVLVEFGAGVEYECGLGAD